MEKKLEDCEKNDIDNKVAIMEIIVVEVVYMQNKKWKQRMGNCVSKENEGWISISKSRRQTLAHRLPFKE